MPILVRKVFGTLLALVAVVCLSVSAFAIDGSEMFQDPAREARAREIGRQLRCLVCQNQSIFDSNAGLAKDLRVLVRARMEEGDSDTEILSYISDRYGDYVLLKPRFTAQNAVLWATPAVVLGLGLILAAFYLRSRTTVPKVASLSEDEREAARKLLQESRS
ncbi:cytochrome c-type biogenesis protein [Roseibium aggregatum]|uniref:Cytochrome c-type biogenesis protein n=1 Tax=Roseibium aggregatum TaxID=187304 RepID=A0A939ECM1_9HYPH|nr:cytochrome c-type biogenesis protein [Roseibium aggregatum]MBN9670861.1 cytochrome c-type biogenesis protein CcmH [Roseibium aggregatum]